MPLLIKASTWKVVEMGLVPEDRASARSDELEARSDARWRVHAVANTLDGITERWPATRVESVGDRLACGAVGSRPLAADGARIREFAG